MGGLLIAKESHHARVLSACGFRDDGTISVGSQKLQAEVALTAAAQNKGLGDRPCIGKNQAMLFAFAQPGQYGFWMKDMNFPIDMVWVSSERKAVFIKEDVLPSTYPNSFDNPKDQPAQYVIEMQAHRSASLGIKPGSAINF